MNNKFFGSKLVLVFTLAGIGLLIFAIGQETYKKYLVEQEINKLEKQVEELKTEKVELNETLAYLQTQSAKELETRKRLNLVKPGEKVAILNNIEEEELDETEEVNENETSLNKDKEKENWILWWELFF